ncbi:uncharacterized protein EDB93DRAFT_1256106 [Suillus bovinus]|uniref:uncharacterized protein n=1 Tax=Suillus bovinus TaxID=48563 RepID=UPI001B86C1D9|nr:uncharacterized protein EDB93DRAFT_1256106 [Suillus bovinus]KAG2129830.1 hypothetical protein EDB93DRAFT_1256106 [Suillus bovinus]
MEQEHVSSPKSEPPPGIVPRFVRSLSKASATTEQSPSTVHVGAEPRASSLPSSASQILQAKSNTIDKLLKYARKAKRPGFPPSSWLVEEGNQAQQPITPTAASLHASPIIDDEIQEAGSSATVDAIQFDGGGEVGVESEPPEPDTLARRIQAMIASLPSVPSGLPTSFPQFYTTPSGTPVIDPNDSPPISSPGFSDSKLTTFLTSFSVMNGSIDRGRESVWSVLDRLRSPITKRDGSAESNAVEPRTGAEYEDDNGSVMMYGPLEPTEDSEIEIARSEIVSLNGDGEEIRTPQLTFVPLPSESIEQVLAQSESSGTGKQRAGHEQVPSSSSVEPKDMTTVAVSEPVEYRVWLPSPTKISVQAMWWGFRIYLPPPVLDALNDKQLEAAKRAAMITTALKWLLDHLPISLMPPQLRTSMSILRRLVPYLGYIGGFIAWSWSAVKVFDKGYGVVLTATWLLPIALIPGTWEATDFPALQAEPQTPAWSKY